MRKVKFFLRRKITVFYVYIGNSAMQKTFNRNLNFQLFLIIFLLENVSSRDEKAKMRGK